MGNENSRPTRRYPAKGVFLIPDQPTIVFVTVCTQGRVPWLADDECHTTLRRAWAEADAWLVGRYVVMPDHVHMFVAPSAKNIEIEPWVKFWKSLVTKRLGDRAKGWQKSCWHHRLRRSESYEQKWQYVVENPVRKGLVQNACDWPFQDELEILPW